MKSIALALIACGIAAPAMARDTYVKPHITKNGTYVEGHHRSAPDGNRMNNYSMQGNVNPYTGQAGTVDPYSQPAPSRGSSYGNSGYGNSSYQQPRNPYSNYR